MKKISIGIDIGKSGAMVLMDGQGVLCKPMPMIATELDLEDIESTLEGWTAGNKAHVVFEKLGVIFGTGKSVAFSMGYQAGVIEMACVSLGIPYTKVSAKVWQKEMFEGVDEITKASRSKKGTTRDTKAMALIAAKRLFPEIKLTFGDRATKPHDGLVDALLMSEYCRRKYL